MLLEKVCPLYEHSDTNTHNLPLPTLLTLAHPKEERGEHNAETPENAPALVAEKKRFTISYLPPPYESPRKFGSPPPPAVQSKSSISIDQSMSCSRSLVGTTPPAPLLLESAAPTAATA
ncbi:hypothetical protein CSPAE12_07866, partial [Colletotrichum incanum]